MVSKAENGWVVLLDQQIIPSIQTVGGQLRRLLRRWEPETGTRKPIPGAHKLSGLWRKEAGASRLSERNSAFHFAPISEVRMELYASVLAKYRPK